MLRIDCPFCGLRDHDEFAYGGDADVIYPALDGGLEEWVRAVFERRNVAGRQRETWLHRHGCRQWLVVERDTTTHEIFSVRFAADVAGERLRAREVETGGPSRGEGDATEIAGGEGGTRQRAADADGSGAPR